MRGSTFEEILYTFTICAHFGSFYLFTYLFTNLFIEVNRFSQASGIEPSA
jgi:hypothetical protein